MRISLRVELKKKIKYEILWGEALIFTKFFRGKPIFFKGRPIFFRLNAILAKLVFLLLSALLDLKVPFLHCSHHVVSSEYNKTVNNAVKMS